MQINLTVQGTEVTDVSVAPDATPASDFLPVLMARVHALLMDTHNAMNDLESTDPKWTQLYVFTRHLHAIADTAGLFISAEPPF